MSATLSLTDSGSCPVEEPLVGNYFVAVYPPFSVWKPEHTPELNRALNTSYPGEPLGLYVHIPFCQKKCDYCYYLSYIGQNAETVNRYIDTIVRELELYAERPGLRERPVSFVYFGGGTPSTLSEKQLQRLGDGLKRALPWNGVKEVTFECAPRSVRAEFLDALRELGVTRLSMGVQSFDNRLLKLNGRVHLAEDVIRAFGQIRAAGFPYVNLDLMAGLIGETFESWQETVGQLIALSPEGVTIYQTEIPHNTRLYQEWKTGTLPDAPVAWDEKRRRLDYAFSELDKAGYTVISAYNAVKDPARHRFQYQEHFWRGKDMLGLGVASFGYFGGVHCQNEVTLADYQARIAAGEIPVKRAVRLTNEQQLVREFILQLKLGRVDSRYFREKFGEEITTLFQSQLEDLEAEGFLNYSNLGVRLTPDGLLRTDRLLPRFYDPQFQQLRYT